MNDKCFHLQDDCSLPAGESCERCVAYTERLALVRSPTAMPLAAGSEQATEASAEPTMSQALRQRLRAIPLTEQRPVDSPGPSRQRGPQHLDEQRLYEDALSRAMGDEGDPEVASYLAQRPRQAKVYAAVAETVRHARRPRLMPRQLRRRVSGWSKRGGLPVWISDVRYAAAACYLLSSLLMFSAQDAHALMQETVNAVSERSVVWVEQGNDYKQTIFESIAGGLEDQWNGGRETVSSWAEGGSDLWAQTWKDLEKTAIGRWWTEAFE